MSVPDVPHVERSPLPELATNAQPVLSASPRTVLVVNDYPAVLAWASRAFERVGWRILIANDGPDALGLFDDAAKRGQPVDLLITDLQLQAVSGATRVRQIRALNPTLPVIALFMGNADDDDRHGSMLDHTSFFQKPVRAATLVAAADALVFASANADDEPSTRIDVMRGGRPPCRVDRRSETHADPAGQHFRHAQRAPLSVLVRSRLQRL